MKSKTLWRRVLSSAIALVMVAGTLSVAPVKVADAATASLISNGGFEQGALIQGQENATVVEAPVRTGSYAGKVAANTFFKFTKDEWNNGGLLDKNTEYVLSAWVYAEEDTTVKMTVNCADAEWEKIDRKEITGATGVATWTKLEWKFTTAEYDMVLQPRFSATTEFYIDDISVKKSNQEDLTLSFKEIDGEGHFLMDHSQIASDLLGAYQTEIYVDGVKQMVWMSVGKNVTYIYKGAFNPDPTTEVRIPEGSVLREYDTDKWVVVPNGKELILTSNMYAVNAKDGWKKETFIAPTGLTFEKVDPANGNWWIKANLPEDYATCGAYWQAEVLVDGNPAKIWVHTTAGYAFIYGQCFEKKPTTSLVIPDGTVLYEAMYNADKISGGRTIKVNTALYVEKVDDQWALHTCKCEHVAKVDATCTAEGMNEYYKCADADCGKIYADAEGTTETTLDALKIAKTAHKYVVTKTKATTKADAKEISKCACGAKKERTIAYRIKSVTASTKTYNGKNQTVSVVVKDSKNKTISSSNYTLDRTKVKDVGSYKIKVTFKGNYSGTSYVTCKVLPKATSLKSVKAGKKSATVKWSKQTSGTTGYKIQVSTDKNFKKSVKTYTVKKNKTTSYTVKSLKAKKTYYVRVCTYKGSVQSSWSKTKSVKIKK